MISVKRRHQYVLSFCLFATLNSSLTPYYKLPFPRHVTHLLFPLPVALVWAKLPSLDTIDTPFRNYFSCRLNQIITFNMEELYSFETSERTSAIRREYPLWNLWQRCVRKEIMSATERAWLRLKLVNFRRVRCSGTLCRVDWCQLTNVSGLKSPRRNVLLNHVPVDAT
jgi:hypothetical protein